jgi:hypothetical protein
VSLWGVKNKRLSLLLLGERLFGLWIARKNIFLGVVFTMLMEC